MAKAKPKSVVETVPTSGANDAKTTVVSTKSAKNVAKAGALGATKLQEQALRIAAGLARTYPDAECALHHSGTFQLLVATILSAQCTDERVNMVTPILFAKYPTPAFLASSKQEDVEEIIHSLGFFRAKATNIRGMALALVDRYAGEVPRELEQLIELPGIGRKTANVVLGTSFGIATGVVVDTHVKRLTRLLGLTQSSTPEQIERDLMKLLPSSEWVNFAHRLIHHGRRICVARRPKCEECPLLPDCARVGLPPLK
ncbi:MAG: pdg [Planctomycetaceae bacterium]|nr:pdg [Planctomycetaceae bacterium]